MPIGASSKDAFLQQAQHVWTMLDDMAANNPEAYKKFIDKQMKDGSEDLSKRNPTAELCVKTWLHEENCFFFVEIFSWTLISAPRVLENEQQELPAHITDVEFQDNGIGDKKSAHVMLVVNPEVIQKLRPTDKQPSPEQRHLMQNILELIEEQTGFSVKTDSFEFLDSTSCMGDPVKLRHKIFNQSKQKCPPSAKTQESVLERLTNIKLSDKSDNDDEENSVSSLLKLEARTASSLKTQEAKELKKKPALISELSDESNHPIEPRYEVDTSYENRVIVTVQLPGVKSAAECEVDLIEDVLTIEVANRYSLLLPLDVKIDEAKTSSAEFSAKSTLLTVRIPILTQQQ